MLTSSVPFSSFHYKNYNGKTEVQFWVRLCRDIVLLSPRMSRKAALEALLGDECVKTTSWETSLMLLYRIGWVC